MAAQQVKTVFKVGEEYEIVSGERVTILSDQCPGEYPLVGYMVNGKNPKLYSWRSDGSHGAWREANLIPPKPRTALAVGYVNVYPIAPGMIHPTDDAAARMAGPGCIARVKVLIEVPYSRGQFDDAGSVPLNVPYQMPGEVEHG